MYFNRILFILFFASLPFGCLYAGPLHLNFDAEPNSLKRLKQGPTSAEKSQLILKNGATYLLETEEASKLNPPRALEFLIKNWHIFGCLYETKALNFQNAVDRGFVLFDWMLNGETRRLLEGLDGNSTDSDENDSDYVAICGDVVVGLISDKDHDMIKLWNLQDGSSTNWRIPRAIDHEEIQKLAASHNQCFFTLKTKTNTYLGNVETKTFKLISFTPYARTPVDNLASPFRFNISPLHVPVTAWQKNPELLSYQPFISGWVKTFTGKDGEYIHTQGSQVFFVPLKENPKEITPINYLKYFMSGFIGENFQPQYLGNIYRVDSAACFQVVSDPSIEKPFQSNINPDIQYFLDPRAGDKAVPKYRVLGGWNTGAQHHLLTEQEAQALKTDVETFVPNPKRPDSLLAYAVNSARLLWKIPQRTKDKTVHTALVDLLNGLQQQTGYDFYPLTSSSFNPETLVFMGKYPIASGKLLVIHPFQGLRHHLIDHEVASISDRVLEKRKPTVQPFSITAKDGTPLYGYVVHPFEHLPHKPGLLSIHGGPAARETWDDCGEYLFYASRGYTVFTLNFRGSKGYGRRFEDALYQNYGTVDLEDNMQALEHAIGQGWVNPNFVGVMGGSYGAYAAVRISEKYPDAFQAVIAENGFYDGATMLEEEEDRERSVFQIGLDPLYQEDKQKLDAQSALREISCIKAPCLIMHGKADSICALEQSVALVQEMQRHSKEVIFVRFKDGKHTLSNPNDLPVKYLMHELFLNRTLGGYSALPTDELKNAPGAKIIAGAEFLTRGLAQQRSQGSSGS